MEMSSEAARIKEATARFRPASNARNAPSGHMRMDVGAIPDDWSTRSLSEIGHCLIGLTYKPSNVRPHGLLVLRAPNIGKSGLQFGNDVFVDVGVPERLLVQPNDLLICVRNGSRRLIGKCTLLDNRAEGMTFGAFMSVFRSEDNHFVAYCFQSDIIKRQIRRDLGATINQITNKSLNSFEVPFPPLSERRAVVEALSDVDALLDDLDRLIAKKRDLKHAAVQQLLTGRTRLSGFDGEWGVKRIGEFASCTAGGTPSTLLPEYWGGSIRWMHSGELHLKQVHDVEGRITEHGLLNSSAKILPTGCVLVGLAGQGKTRGTVAMNLVPLCTNQSIAGILPNSTFVSEYLYHNLDSRYDELRDLSSGGGGRGGLNLTIIRSILVPFPSVSEQLAIATVISDMDAEIAALEARRDKTRDLKQAMMQELLTGKTRLVQREMAHA